MSPTKSSSKSPTKSSRLIIDPLDFRSKDEVEMEAGDTCDEADSRNTNRSKLVTSGSSRIAKVLMLGTGGDS